ncbi:hypothetical protein RFI_02575 [Reticulomyxa filosa]|uniref:Uncharacterized protein n=1 Tax=Reticulomyxa filosa TaxID=46433 RepID=X6P8J6_RETFI|nr:hypothetical protein RFI_02575 [Reticulomyxa filosa]|eukprot:ETO34521.1 hypothetical protein RFI_02575 [Reticulomyxa filosa]
MLCEYSPESTSNVPADESQIIDENASKQKYFDFIQDLLITINDVERIKNNADTRKIYISILPKLYSKMQILKEMVLHGYLSNNLALYSDEATRLNCCLELMLLKKEVKVDIINIISNMVCEDIDLSQLEENQSLFNSLEKINYCCYKQYERALYMWFLKQLYMWKGIHWIDIIFTQPNVGMKYLFGKLKTNNIILFVKLFKKNENILLYLKRH